MNQNSPILGKLYLAVSAVELLMIASVKLQTGRDHTIADLHCSFIWSNILGHIWAWSQDEGKSVRMNSLCRRCCWFVTFWMNSLSGYEVVPLSDSRAIASRISKRRPTSLIPISLRNSWFNRNKWRPQIKWFVNACAILSRISVGNVWNSSSSWTHTATSSEDHSSSAVKPRRRLAKSSRVH